MQQWICVIFVRTSFFGVLVKYSRIVAYICAYSRYQTTFLRESARIWNIWVKLRNKFVFYVLWFHAASRTAAMFK